MSCGKCAGKKTTESSKKKTKKTCK